MSIIAGKYIKLSFNGSHTIFSFRIIKNNINQNNHSKALINLLDDVRVELYIAKKDMITNNISINFHHVGGVLQQLKDPACAIKINGVDIQCKRHNVLAIAPTLSGF